MRGSEFLDKMELVDHAYIEAADQAPVKTRKRPLSRPMAACIALVLLVFAAGTTAVATGLYNDLLLYFKGDTELYIDGIIEAGTSVSNEQITLRIDGAVADEYACYMVVSLVGHTKEATKQIVSHAVSQPVGLEAYALSHSGGKITFWNWGFSGKYQRIGYRNYDASLFEDADATYIVTCEWGSNVSMENVKSICITYDDLTADLDIQNYIVPTHSLICTDDADSILTNGHISSLGLYFDVPMELFPEDYATCAPEDMPQFEIKMIRTDGSIQEDLPFGFRWGTNYNREDRIAHISGSWKSGGEHQIYIIDLEAYSGIQINGISYYFK